METADYIIDYIPTAEELADFNVFASGATPDGRQRVKKFKLLTALRIALLAAATVVLTGFMLMRSYFSAVLLIELAAMVALIIVIAVNGSYEKRVRKLIKKRVAANPSMIQQVQLIFYPERFEMKKEKGSSVLEYSGVIAAKITDKVVYMMTSPVSGCVVTAESLKSDYPAFCAYIKEKLPQGIII